MALALGGRRAEAERAYDWLVDLQRPDGSWHQYYLGRLDRAGQARRQRRRLRRRRRVAPLAAHRRPGLRRGDVAGRRAGHRLRARPADAPGRDPLGPPRRRHAVVVRPAHRLVEHLPQPALRHRPRPSCSATSGPTGSSAPPAWPTSSGPLRGDLPDAFAPKHRWAMDWYYPVLAGVVARRARAASASTPAATTFIVDGMGVRCVSDRPWITAAETCECLLAYLVGRRARHGPRRCSSWAQQLRDDDGHYWTGIVFPEMVHFPGDEQLHLHRGLDRAGRRRPGRHQPGLGAVRRPRRAAGADRHRRRRRRRRPQPRLTDRARGLWSAVSRSGGCVRPVALVGRGLGLRRPRRPSTRRPSAGRRTPRSGRPRWAPPRTATAG